MLGPVNRFNNYSIFRLDRLGYIKITPSCQGPGFHLVGRTPLPKFLLQSALGRVIGGTRLKGWSRVQAPSCAQFMLWKIIVLEMNLSVTRLVLSFLNSSFCTITPSESVKVTVRQKSIFPQCVQAKDTLRSSFLKEKKLHTVDIWSNWREQNSQIYQDGVDVRKQTVVSQIFPGHFSAPCPLRPTWNNVSRKKWREVVTTLKSTASGLKSTSFPGPWTRLAWSVSPGTNMGVVSPKASVPCL